jgi:mRNA interferase MazF
LERLPVGSITFLFVPYPDGSGGKRRPTVVLSKVNEVEYWLAEITSQSLPLLNGLFIEQADFSSGGLRKPSQVRCDRLLTANEELLRDPEAVLKPEVVSKIVSRIISLLPKV